MSVQVRELVGSDHEWVARFLEKQWGSTKIVSRGEIYCADRLPGFIASQDGKAVGLVTYRIAGDQCEIISLNSLAEGAGVGGTLIDTVKQCAISAKCKRVWLVTTNDNTAALRFYQKRGFLLVAIHRYAADKARRLKPEIPLVGADGIPLRDEVELELLL